MSGLFIVFEGGDGAGKTTQAEILTEWLRDSGETVCRTFEPGDSRIGAGLRKLVLDPTYGEVAPRAEALMYAADKAQHVYEVVNPALERGEIVVCDRYVDSMLAYQGAGRVLELAEVTKIAWDSMLAYQGAGRVLELAEVTKIAWWATESLKPDLTVVLDVAPADGVDAISTKDRVEAAGDDFHHRARQYFLDLAAEEPERYLVLPARDPIEQNSNRVRGRVADLLSRR